MKISVRASIGLALALAAWGCSGSSPTGSSSGSTGHTTGTTGSHVSTTTSGGHVTTTTTSGTSTSGSGSTGTTSATTTGSTSTTTGSTTTTTTTTGSTTGTTTSGTTTGTSAGTTTGTTTGTSAGTTTGGACTSPAPTAIDNGDIGANCGGLADGGAATCGAGEDCFGASDAGMGQCNMICDTSAQNCPGTTNYCYDAVGFGDGGGICIPSCYPSTGGCNGSQVCWPLTPNPDDLSSCSDPCVDDAWCNNGGSTTFVCDRATGFCKCTQDSDCAVLGSGLTCDPASGTCNVPCDASCTGGAGCCETVGAATFCDPDGEVGGTSGSTGATTVAQARQAASGSGVTLSDVVVVLQSSYGTPTSYVDGGGKTQFAGAYYVVDPSDSSAITVYKKKTEKPLSYDPVLAESVNVVGTMSYFPADAGPTGQPEIINPGLDITDQGAGTLPAGLTATTSQLADLSGDGSLVGYYVKVPAGPFVQDNAPPEFKFSFADGGASYDGVALTSGSDRILVDTYTFKFSNPSCYPTDGGKLPDLSAGNFNGVLDREQTQDGQLHKVVFAGDCQ